MDEGILGNSPARDPSTVDTLTQPLPKIGATVSGSCGVETCDKGKAVILDSEENISGTNGTLLTAYTITELYLYPILVP